MVRQNAVSWSIQRHLRSRRGSSCVFYGTTFTWIRYLGHIGAHSSSRAAIVWHFPRNQFLWDESCLRLKRRGQVWLLDSEKLVRLSRLDTCLNVWASKCFGWFSKKKFSWNTRTKKFVSTELILCRCNKENSVDLFNQLENLLCIRSQEFRFLQSKGPGSFSKIAFHVHTTKFFLLCIFLVRLQSVFSLSDYCWLGGALALHFIFAAEFF